MTIDELLRNDSHLSVIIGPSVLPEGGYSAMLMTMGSGSPIMGRGATSQDAIDDLGRKMKPTKRPALPGLE